MDYLPFINPRNTLTKNAPYSGDGRITGGTNSRSATQLMIVIGESGTMDGEASGDDDDDLDD